jgi:hypothetical protein
VGVDVVGVVGTGFIVVKIVEKVDDVVVEIVVTVVDVVRV